MAQKGSILIVDDEVGAETRIDDQSLEFHFVLHISRSLEWMGRVVFKLAVRSNT